MAVVETEAIVLRTYDLSDADRIVVMLTRDHGVIRAVAKGAKRLKSRFGGGLEPFSRITAEYYKKENQELSSLNKAEILDSSFAYASQPDFLAQFSYLSDILLALLPPEDPNEKLFRMVNAAINAAGTEPKHVQMIGLYFEVWLLRLSGFLPDWTRCAACKGDIGDDESARLTADMHLLGESCQRSNAGEPVSANDRRSVENTKTLGPADFAATCDESDAARMSAIFRRMIAAATGREHLSKALSAGVERG